MCFIFEHRVKIARLFRIGALAAGAMRRGRRLIPQYGKVMRTRPTCDMVVPLQAA
jgi:hypothetical protein